MKMKLKLKKVTINGEEYYKACDDIPQNNKKVKVEICEEEELHEGKSFKKSSAEFIEKLNVGAKNFGNKIATGAKDLGQKIREQGEKFFGKDKTLDENSKEAKLIKLLPYMNKREIHELAQKMLASDDTVKSLDLIAIMPFLSEDDADKLFLNSVRVGNTAYDFAKIVPYVSKRCLSEVVDGYIDGEYQTLDVDKLYPFLNDGDIKRLFYHILNGEI